MHAPQAVAALEAGKHIACTVPAEQEHLSFTQGGGHGGSHSHLAHEFVSNIAEGRASLPDLYQSVNWNCAGICAHESAMRGGEIVRLPDFR